MGLKACSTVHKALASCPQIPCVIATQCFCMSVHVQTFPPQEKWKYAYPGVLEGVLEECTWTVNEACTPPLKGNDCFKIRCLHIDYDCPPKGQPVCPHFSKVSCGWMPGTHKKYWMHKCNPLATPSTTKVSYVTCKPQPLKDGAFQCYFAQACSSPSCACPSPSFSKSGACLCLSF
jgi:hypothetical protein